MRALCRGRRRSRRRAAYNPPKPPPAITTSYATAAEASAKRRRERLRWPGAGAPAAAPDPPGRTREHVVGDGREALLVDSQREQQVGDAVGRGQVRLGGGDAEGVDGAAAVGQEQRARLADQPGPQLARLDGQ